MLLLETSMFR